MCVCVCGGGGGGGGRGGYNWDFMIYLKKLFTTKFVY